MTARRNQVNACHILRTHGFSGGENQLAGLFREHERIGGDITFYLLSVFNDLIFEKKFAEFSNSQVGRLLRIGRSRNGSAYLDLIIICLLFPFIFRNFSQHFKDSRISVCFCHGFIAGFIGSIMALFYGKKIRFFYVHRGYKQRFFPRWFFRWLYGPFVKIIGVSQSTLKSLETIVDNNRLVLIRNAIGNEHFSAQINRPSELSSNQLRAVTVCRLIASKNLAFLIDIVRRLMEKEVMVQLTILGDGPELRRLQRLTAEMDLQKNIIFKGRVENIRKELESSDQFWFASLHEGLSNAVLEAMAAGLPSVVLDAPGVSECHIHGVTGYITKDADDFTVSVLALKTEELARQFSESARRHAAAFNFAKNVSDYSELIVGGN